SLIRLSKAVRVYRLASVIVILSRSDWISYVSIKWCNFPYSSTLPQRFNASSSSTNTSILLPSSSSGPKPNNAVTIFCFSTRLIPSKSLPNTTSLPRQSPTRSNKSTYLPTILLPSCSTRNFNSAPYSFAICFKNSYGFVCLLRDNVLLPNTSTIPTCQPVSLSVRPACCEAVPL